ncbi:hypothetical protein FF1_033020 [Malus domestica]
MPTRKKESSEQHLVIKPHLQNPVNPVQKAPKTALRSAAAEIVFIIHLTGSSFGEGTAPSGDPSFHQISEHHNGLVKGWNHGAAFIKV